MFGMNLVSQPMLNKIILLIQLMFHLNVEKMMPLQNMPLRDNSITANMKQSLIFLNILSYVFLFMKATATKP
ncbi:hypothetical protein C3941_28185 [Kaistia algarum]|nr:hypothetical protein C3941_28185 [Kaistia algarum]